MRRRTKASILVVASVLLFVIVVPFYPVRHEYLVPPQGCSGITCGVESVSYYTCYETLVYHFLGWGGVVCYYGSG